MKLNRNLKPNISRNSTSFSSETLHIEMAFRFSNHHSFIHIYRVFFIFFLFFGMMVSDDVLAQNQSSEQKLLQRYIDMALENNAGLKSGTLNVEASRLQSKEFGSLGDPQLELSYDAWSRMNPTSRFSLLLMQPVPWFGKLSTTRRYFDQLSKAEEERFTGSQNELVFQLRNMWYEIHEAEHHIHISLDNLDILEQLENQILSQLEVGRGSQIDVLRIQIEREELLNRISEFENVVFGLIARFNVLLNRNRDAEIEILYELQAEPVPTRYMDSISIEENPDVRELQAASAASQTAIDNARLSGRPDFMVGFGLMNRDLLLGDPERINTVELMFRMNLPIYRGQYRAQEQRARLESRMIDQTKIELENQLTGEFYQAQKQLDTAINNQKLYSAKLIPMAQQALEIAISSYGSGGNTFEQIIQLQRQVLDYEMKYNTAVANHNKALARLDFLSGQSPYSF